jgi:hypothetical protein
MAIGAEDIWVAHRRAGFFTRLQRSGERWKVTLFHAHRGYGPVDSHFIKRDSRGWIWRGSPEGVHISDGRRVAPEDWLHIRMGNGLAADQTDMFGFFEDADGSVWIAGAEGVTRARPDASWFAAPAPERAPRVTRVEADGRVSLFPGEEREALPSATRLLRIDVGGLDGAPFRDAPLRYRLRGLGDDWRVSQDGSLEFHNPRDGRYALELMYAGDGARAVATYEFQVGRAVSWLWLLGIPAGAGALLPLARRRSWIERAKFRIQKQMFLLRRRWRGRNVSSPAGSAGTAEDYSGGTLAGRYEIGRVLSRGGFSVVYEGRDTRDGTRVAVKVVNRGPGQESWVRNRFAHEVAALRSVRHPGVAPLLDSWISPAGEPCLAMPFLEGRTLREELEAGPLAPARAASIARQVGAALAEVHGRGIIHRDLKPENLMLCGERAVIIDFGTAGLRTAEDELARTTLMSGSFHYMAPERLTGHYSAASDVFSLGVVILEMLTGKRLSDIRVMFTEPAFFGALEKALAERLGPAARAVAERLAPALDAEPRRRPQGAREWAEAVAAAIDQA